MAAGDAGVVDEEDAGKLAQIKLLEGQIAARKELKRVLQEQSVFSAPDDSSTNRYAKYSV